MIKQKLLDIHATNISNLGSDLEKKVREAAAENEEQWSDAGKKPGLQIWRIENFQVVDWPKDQYGTFYSGDSYIVLNTYQKEGSEALHFDVHFWLGEFTSVDEAGTAAYKTVELDDVLNGKPVQYREVAEHESDLFKSYFDNEISILDGGVDSAFNHVEEKEYVARLLHIKGSHHKNVCARQCRLSGEELNSGDVFILDNGLNVYQWNGSSAGIFEKHKAAQMTRAMDDQRKGQVQIHVISEGDDCDKTKEFWELLGGKCDIKPAHEAGSDKEGHKVTPKLFRLSDASGDLTLTEVEFSHDSLESNDVFILDNVCEIFAWVGNNASDNEKRKGIHYAQDYLAKVGRPENITIARVLEGGEDEEFHACFSH